jgi:arsenate reductase
MRHMASTPVIYYNPDCSKSRQALSLLRGLGFEPIIRHYLEQPPSRDELLALIAQLDDAPESLVRDPGIPLDSVAGHGAATGAEAIAELLVSDPTRLQRPIVVCDGTAIIARPPERLLALIEEGSH